jgi:cobalt-zinc-cadmium efflux system membrane fusion protein
MKSVKILLALALLSCGGKKKSGLEPDERGERGEHGEHGEHGDHHEEGAARHASAGDQHAARPAGPQMVHIASEMIRDLRVTTAKAEARSAGERVSVLAELRVDQDAYAEVASPAPARVSRVLAKAGDEVKLNQPLVELASGDLSRARAEVQAADARVAIARQNLERKQALLAERLIPEREVIEAQTAVAEAEAGRTVAAGAIRQFAGAEGGSGLVLRAPVAGTVIQRDVALGQLVDPSKTLFRIGDLSTLWLVAHVFERDAVRVQTGGHGTATFAALPGKTIEGKITWIGREVETASRTVPVRLEVPNPDGVLRPGMSATVSIPVGEIGGAVVSVPIAAVQRVDDKWAVFVPREPGVFEARPVGRGRDLGGEIEILSGLGPGDEVVVDGAFLLKAEFDKARGEGGHDHDH